MFVANLCICCKPYYFAGYFKVPVMMLLAVQWCLKYLTHFQNHPSLCSMLSYSYLMVQKKIFCRWECVRIISYASKQSIKTLNKGKIRLVFNLLKYLLITHLCWGKCVWFQRETCTWIKNIVYISLCRRPAFSASVYVICLVKFWVICSLEWWKITFRLVW